MNDKEVIEKLNKILEEKYFEERYRFELRDCSVVLWNGFTNWNDFHEYPIEYIDTWKENLERTADVLLHEIYDSVLGLFLANLKRIKFYRLDENRVNEKKWCTRYIPEKNLTVGYTLNGFSLIEKKFLILSGVSERELYKFAMENLKKNKIGKIHEFDNCCKYIAESKSDILSIRLLNGFAKELNSSFFLITLADEYGRYVFEAMTPERFKTEIRERMLVKCLFYNREYKTLYRVKL